MTLDSFSQPEQSNKVSLKEALRRMRAIFFKGTAARFDLKLSKILDCSLDRASRIRESWEILGFLVYTERGLLTWKNGGF